MKMIKVVSKGFYKKKLLFGIAIVGLLLLLCVAVDSADESIVLNESSLAENVPNGAILTNNSSIVAVNESASVIVVKHNDVIHTIKPKYPTISMWAKPSCGCRNNYRWHYRTFVNYCPHCHHYNCLVNKHKWQSRYEQELTCKYCDSDFCGVCGKTKYSWSRTYLRRA